MIRIAPLLAALCALLLFSSARCSDDEPGKPKLAGAWATGGYGAPIFGTNAWYLGATFLDSNGRIYIARAAATRDHAFSVTPDMTVQDYSLLVGAVERPARVLRIYAAGGLGMAYITKRGKLLSRTINLQEGREDLVFEKRTFQRAAVPLEVHVQYTPIKYAALGVVIFGDLNTERSFVAGALSLHIGYIP